MGIASTCPHCLTVFELHPSLRGQSVRCKRCDHVYTVTDRVGKRDEEPLLAELADLRTAIEVLPVVPAGPRRPNARRPDDDDDPPLRSRHKADVRRGGSRKVLFIVLGIGAALFGVVLLGVGAWLLWPAHTPGGGPTAILGPAIASKDEP